MPFEQPTPAVLPPAPPRFGMVLLFVLLLLMLAAPTHAQPTQRQIPPQDFTTTQSTAQDGAWTGHEPPPAGGHRHFDTYGPHGEVQHCRSYEFSSGTAHTDCY